MDGVKSFAERLMDTNKVIGRCTGGNDFRPDYKKLGVLKQQFPDVPILALTATATQRVRR